MPRNSNPVPDLLIERLALRDLDPERAADVRSRLEAAGDLTRLGEIEASNRAILAAHPPSLVFAEVQRRLARDGLEPASRPRELVGRPWLGLALGALAAATAVVVLVPRAPRPSRQAGETITLKGPRGPHLVIYRQTPEGPARLTDTARLHAGDMVQVAYVAGGRRFGVVATQDARGSVTFLLPTGGSQAAELADAGERATANAFELDDSPGFEKFVFVTSDVPFQKSAVLEALRSRDGSRLPRDAAWSELVLAKETR
jgi:hypothetical protein